MQRQTIQIGIWMPVGSSIIVPVKVSTPVMISSVSPGRMKPDQQPGLREDDEAHDRAAPTHRTPR